MVEDRGRDVLLRRIQRRHCLFEMAVDNPPRSAQAAQGLEAENRRAGLGLGMPDALHDELEIRSLYRVARPAFGRGDLVEHGFDELRLCGARAAVLGEPRVALERSDDRGARGLTAQSVESERVAEEPRDAALEAIEARKLVLSEADEKPDPQARLAQSLRELLDEASFAVFGLVVEQVFVELVEHDVEVAFERERPGVSAPVSEPAPRAASATSSPAAAASSPRTLSRTASTGSSRQASTTATARSGTPPFARPRAA